MTFYFYKNYRKLDRFFSLDTEHNPDSEENHLLSLIKEMCLKCATKLLYSLKLINCNQSTLRNKMTHYCRFTLCILAVYPIAEKYLKNYKSNISSILGRSREMTTNRGASWVV